VADAVLVQHGDAVHHVKQHRRHELLGEKLFPCSHLSDQAAQISQLPHSNGAMERQDTPRPCNRYELGCGRPTQLRVEAARLSLRTELACATTRNWEVREW
jgi:hypothetical protein